MQLRIAARSQIPSFVLPGVLALCAGAALGGCAAQPTAEKPAWVASPQNAVNPSTTLVAVGQGGDPESARAAAEKAVTQEVASRVGAPGFDIAQFETRMLRAGDDPRQTVELLAPREFVAAAPLVGIQYAQQTQDPRTGRFATMATIDRAGLTNAYLNEAARNADRAARLWNSASGQNAYQFTETLIAAQLAAQARDALARGAQKIGASLATPPGVTAYRPTIEEIRVAMTQAQSPVSAGVFAQSEIPASIADEIKQELFRLRVPQFTDQSKADIDLMTRLTFEPTNQGAAQAVLVNWRLVIEPVTRTGTNLEALVLEGKTGSRSWDEARQEAARLALVELREKGEDYLRRVLYSQGTAPVLPPVVSTTVTNTTTTTTTTTTVQSPTVTTTTITPAPAATTTTTTTTAPAGTPPSNTPGQPADPNQPAGNPK